MNVVRNEDVNSAKTRAKPESRTKKEKFEAKTILPTPSGGPREFARGRVLRQDSGQTIEQNQRGKFSHQNNLTLGGNRGLTAVLLGKSTTTTKAAAGANFGKIR
jgi:hypothetical protein